MKFMNELKSKIQTDLKMFQKNDAGSVDALISIAIGITVLLIVMGYIFAPVGLTAFAAANVTSLTGTPGLAIWNAIIPISMAVIILALVSIVKSKA